MLLLLLLGTFLSFVQSGPLAPGQPGGPWFDDEIDIVREKVNVYLKHMNDVRNSNHLKHCSFRSFE